MVTAGTTHPRTNGTEIRAAATEAAARDWPVVPGTYPHRGRWYGRPDATGLGPLTDDWPHDTITDPAQAQKVWTGHPYSVLLVCGRNIDALELPPATPAMLPDLDHDVLGAPIALAFPPPRWLVLVTPGVPVRSDLAAAGVRLRTTGEWVALPPTHLGDIRACWRVPPSDHPLPSSAQVQSALAHALHRAGRP